MRKDFPNGCSKTLIAPGRLPAVTGGSPVPPWIGVPPDLPVRSVNPLGILRIKRQGSVRPDGSFGPGTSLGPRFDLPGPAIMVPIVDVHFVQSSQPH